MRVNNKLVYHACYCTSISFREDGLKLKTKMISCKTVHLKTTPINEEEADSEEYSNSEADDVCALRFKKPCWQVRVLFLSLLINPLLYRVYQILVTIGYIFCSSGSSDQICE